MTPGSSKPSSGDTPAAPRVELPLGDAGLRDVLVAGRDILIRNTRSVFSSPAQVLALLLYVTILAALAGSIYWLWRQPSALRGDFNIAVAEFREVQPGGSLQRTRAATDVGQSLAHFLEAEYKPAGYFGLAVEVGHRNMPYVASEEEAAALARRTGADLVVYGTLSRSGDRATLLPRFFVVREIRTDAGRRAEIGRDVDEVAGAHPFALDLGPAPGQPGPGVGGDVAQRAAVLASFTQGLVLLHGDYLEPARAAFGEAVQRAGQLAGFEGQQVLFLFAATVDRRLGAYEDALADVAQALAAKPGYGRALIAQANVYFSLAVDGYDETDGCLHPDLDAKVQELCQSPMRQHEAWPYLLSRAREIYVLAGQAAGQDFGYFIKEKASLGVGNVDLILAQKERNLPTLYERAIASYQQVVDAHNGLPADAREKTRDLAAHAYWGLGVAAGRLGRPEQAAEAYRQCTRVARYDEGIRQDCRDLLDALETREAKP